MIYVRHYTSFYKVMIDRAKALTQPSCEISLVIFGSSDRQHNTFYNLLDQEHLFSASRAHLFLPLRVGTITQNHQQKQN